MHGEVFLTKFEVWIADETLSRMQVENREVKSSKSLPIKTGHPNHYHSWDLLCYNYLIIKFEKSIEIIRPVNFVFLVFLVTVSLWDYSLKISWACVFMPIIKSSIHYYDTFFYNPFMIPRYFFFRPVITCGFKLLHALSHAKSLYLISQVPLLKTWCLRWLKTVSSTCILMCRYSHSLSLDATIMVSKSCPTIGEHVVVLFIT